MLFQRNVTSAPRRAVQKSLTRSIPRRSNIMHSNKKRMMNDIFDVMKWKILIKILDQLFRAYHLETLQMVVKQ
jgi:hypothetical protein